MQHSGHGGNILQLARRAGRSPREILDFSANINPLGPPEWFRGVVSRALDAVVHYPDPEYSSLVEAVASRYGVAPEEVIVGNGSTEILNLIPRVVRMGRSVIPVPAYSEYAGVVEAAGLPVAPFYLREQTGFRLDAEALSSEIEVRDLVFICRPNNPTGLICSAQDVRYLAARHPDSLFVVDEAFGDFVPGFESLTLHRPPNVLVLLSLTKIFAIPGLRLGVAVADPDLAAAVKSLAPTWSVNVIAQAVGEAALQDGEYVAHSRELVQTQRAALQAELATIPGLKVYPGTANFLLLRLDHPDLTAAKLAARMLHRGVAIRVCDNFMGLDERYFRVAVRTAEDNLRLVAALEQSLHLAKPVPAKRPTPAVMFQGTSSNAGKSLLTAAMGRILLQDGWRVAPFKAQNMSLNSFVTRQGGEMGRAQVVQAQACRLEPDVRMNPILLKPNSDTGSQIIVMGRPVGNMNVMDYVGYKPTAFEAVKAAYDDLAGEYDVIVLEGAGSPAEVNLKHHDIVNMQMARYAKAPVLVVGDIDRGGVFAAFVGTMEVLSPWERDLIAGFVVNRFRGNQDLLADALDFTLRHTGRPVLGVVPYVHQHGLPEEDSVSFKQGLFDLSAPAAEADAVDLALIDLPHVSNFTDFDAFRIEPDVRLRIVRSVAELGRPDAVILPGSKNVIGDLAYLRQTGLDAQIKHLRQAGRTQVVGICGGFQMIGASVDDPHRLESSDGRTITGLGLLPVTTVLAQEKTLTRVSGQHLDSGCRVHGYEIHHGLTKTPDLAPVVQT
ncbi:MAG: cobyric acid synthase, partial [Deltaproteobacteria bacterium]|nr:cobyric acid synthase [Deltaproteobacteria bacterium]